jgi:hypothetical protein
VTASFTAVIWSRRRAARPFAIAALAVGVSACGTFSDNDAAAVVGEAEVSRDELESILQGLADNVETTGLTVDEATGSTPDGRQVLNVLVQQQVLEQFLADNGEEITDDDRAAVTASVAEDDPFFELPDDVVRVILDQQASGAAVARIPAPPAEELERRYADDPSSLGVMCVRHILSDTEAEAEAVRRELVAGADFATLAAERSTDPTAPDNGGAIQSQSGDACMAATEASQRLDPAFVAGALEATPGTPTQPVASAFGWHVIEAVPYEDAADSLTALFEQRAGELLYTGFLRSVDVEIDPRYGVWNTVQQSIQPLA